MEKREKKIYAARVKLEWRLLWGRQVTVGQGENLKEQGGALEKAHLHSGGT